MNHQQHLEIFQQSYLKFLFNVEYILSLNIKELAWLYYQCYCMVQQWHFDSHVFIRQLSFNFQVYARQYQWNIIQAYFPRPWNLICNYLSWSDVNLLAEALFEKSEELKASHSKAAKFEKRLALILMPYEKSHFHYLHHDAREVLQLSCQEKFESLDGLFDTIKNNLN